MTFDAMEVLDAIEAAQAETFKNNRRTTFQERREASALAIAESFARVVAKRDALKEALTVIQHETRRQQLPITALVNGIATNALGTTTHDE